MSVVIRSHNFDAYGKAQIGTVPGNDTERENKYNGSPLGMYDCFNRPPGGILPGASDG